MGPPAADAGGTRRGWPRWAVAVLSIGVLGLAAYSYFVPPGEPLGLRAGENQGRLEFSWHGTSAALWQARYGILEVREGARALRLYLDRGRLAEGRFDYQRESERVEARMRVLRVWGAPVEEAVVFLGGPPEPRSESPEARALDQVQRERDELAIEVQRLRRELQRQRARLVQLEQANRSLRESLELEAARGR